MQNIIFYKFKYSIIQDKKLMYIQFIVNLSEVYYPPEFIKPVSSKAA